MSEADDGPYCPECGEPISGTAAYCMHCYADLTDWTPSAEATTVDDGPDDEGGWVTDSDSDPDPSGDATGENDGAGESAPSAGTDASGGDDALLDPDGLADNALTVVVGIGGGVVVGLVATVVLLVLTESAWGFAFGIVVWLAATAYLVRRRTVVGAVARTAYAVAVVLLLVPLVAFSPAMEATDLVGRVVIFATVLLGVAVPAAIAAGVGLVVSQFVPEPGSEG
jgi:hypothetical protein